MRYFTLLLLITIPLVAGAMTPSRVNEHESARCCTIADAGKQIGEKQGFFNRLSQKTIQYRFKKALMVAVRSDKVTRKKISPLGAGIGGVVLLGLAFLSPAAAFLGLLRLILVIAASMMGLLGLVLALVDSKKTTEADTSERAQYLKTAGIMLCVLLILTTGLWLGRIGLGFS